MDAFDQHWQWADKLESLLIISAELHRAVMDLIPTTGGIVSR